MKLYMQYVLHLLNDVTIIVDKKMTHFINQTELDFVRTLPLIDICLGQGLLIDRTYSIQVVTYLIPL